MLAGTRAAARAAPAGPRAPRGGDPSGYCVYECIYNDLAAHQNVICEPREKRDIGAIEVDVTTVS